MTFFTRCWLHVAGYGIVSSDSRVRFFLHWTYRSDTHTSHPSLTSPATFVLCNHCMAARLVGQRLRYESVFFIVFRGGISERRYRRHVIGGIQTTVLCDDLVLVHTCIDRPWKSSTQKPVSETMSWGQRHARHACRVNGTMAVHRVPTEYSSSRK